MADDRVIANTLEQSKSTDFNAAQAMQARRVNDLLVYEHAQHAIPMPWNPDALAQPYDCVDVPQAIVTGLNVYGGVDATYCTVRPGSLTQVAPTWVTASDPASYAQTGFLRVAIDISYPSTPGVSTTSTEAWHLLCARLVEYESSTMTVKIFDTGTQQFVNTSVPKRKELRIEFKWVSGSVLDANTMALPSLDAGGEGWEPIAYISAATGGTATTNNNGRVIDVARRVGGLSGEFNANRQAIDSTYQIGGPMTARLQSARSPDCGVSVEGGLSGLAVGALGGERVLFAASPDKIKMMPFEANDGTTFATGALVHAYLVPFVSSTRTRWPMRTQFGGGNGVAGVTRGILVASSVQPTRHRTNSTTINLRVATGNSGKWVDQLPVPEGYAQYLGSGHKAAGSVLVILPQVQGNGSVLYALGEAAAPLCPTVLAIPSATGLTALNRAWQLDLRSFVPRIATAVYLLIEGGEDDFPTHTFEVRNYVNNTANSVGGSAAAAHANAGVRLAVGCSQSVSAEPLEEATATLIRVPVGWTPSNAHNDGASDEGYHLNLLLREFSKTVGSGLAVSAGTVRLVGWDI